MQRPYSKIYNASGCHALDHNTIQNYGVPGFTLMRRAGQRAASILMDRWPPSARVDVLCGSGNNGGDGYIVAACLNTSGYACTVYAVSEPKSEDARAARDMAREAGVEVCEATRYDGEGEIVVDALLGIGLTRSPDATYAELIWKINQASARVLSLDTPSGLNVDSGEIPGSVVQADLTVSFIAYKLGLLTGYGPDVVGELLLEPLDVPQDVYNEVDNVAFLIEGSDLMRHLPPRKQCAHKGSHGHALIIGGNAGMTGALRIASEAALRGGCGLITAICPQGLSQGVNVSQPEIMAREVDASETGLADFLNGKQAIAIGPGLGTDAWAQSMMTQVVTTEHPLVVDADGLNWLSTNPGVLKSAVLTPHPGEAARLLSTTTYEIQSDRYGAVLEIARRYQCVALLKGCGTLVSDGQQVRLCNAGNPGMGSGGMGDCLTGIITALIAQGMTAFDAASLGVWLHADAADKLAARHGMIGMAATDLLPIIRRTINGLS